MSEERNWEAADCVHTASLEVFCPVCVEELREAVARAEQRELAVAAELNEVDITLRREREGHQIIAAIAEHDRSELAAYKNALHDAVERFKALHKLAVHPMKSWDAGRVIDAQRVEDECGDALEAIGILTARYEETGSST